MLFTERLIRNKVPVRQCHPVLAPLVRSRKISNSPRAITKQFLDLICEIMPALSIASRIQGKIVNTQARIGTRDVAIYAEVRK